MRPPTAQWTVTGAGALILAAAGDGPRVTMATTGTIVDAGITDTSNMGAAMAPAAYETLRAHFADTGRTPDDYDLIVTGDLGKIGHAVVQRLFADDGVELIAITRGTAKGKLLIVRDPSRVILGVSSEEFNAKTPGLQLTELVAKYGCVAGTNAGGFNDENGRGNGGVPQGLVISGGALLHTAREDERYNVVGFDADHILHVGTMTADEALAQGLTDAVSFRTHDGLASSLIINGEVQSKNLGGGVNPRTAIGQCADGSVLLLVLDGRSINTLGATMQDVADIMLEYGAVNAGNLDGGSSSVMVYDGEIINNCASVTGPRNIPTAFIVLPEGD